MIKTIQRRHDIDIARAVAIFAVVLHHISQYFVRYNLEHFSPNLGDAIIATVSYINIPIFMLIAGIIFALGNQRFNSLSDYWRFERKKLYRLMLPFLAISAIQLAIKTVLFDGSISDVSAGLVAMAISPVSAPAPHLWFLYTLMSIFLIWPLLGRLTSPKMTPILWIMLVIVAVLPISWPVDENNRFLFSLGNLIWYLPIFTFGYWYGSSSIGQRRYGLFAIIIAGILFVSTLLSYHLVCWPEDYIWMTLREFVRLVGHISSALFFLWLCGIIDTWNNRLRTSLNVAGLYSYDIFLLHVTFAAHPLVFIISKKLHPGMIMTYVLFMVTIAAVIILPIMFGRIIRRLPLLAFVMLGVPKKPA